MKECLLDSTANLISLMAEGNLYSQYFYSLLLLIMIIVMTMEHKSRLLLEKPLKGNGFDSCCPYVIALTGFCLPSIGMQESTESTECGTECRESGWLSNNIIMARTRISKEIAMEFLSKY